MNNRLRFYFSIYSKSYKILNSINQIEKIENQITFLENSNCDLNTFIFKYLKINCENSDYQFNVDSINFFIEGHLKKRIEIYKLTKRLGKNGFVVWSFINSIFYFFKVFINTIFLSLSEFEFFNKRNSNYNIICFGFPTHSFVRKEFSPHNSSFIGYLLNNNKLSKEIKILSIDEYKRPSLKNNNSNYETLNFYARDLVKKKIKLTKLFQIPSAIYFALFDFFINKKKGIFNFIYYFKLYVRGSFIKNIISKIESENQYLYFNQFYDIGNLKYKIDHTNFQFYNYSQNIFIPPSQQINKLLLHDINSINLNDILKEMSFHIFSLYNPHTQVNLTSHFKFYNTLTQKINKNFKLNLFKIKYLENEKNSNLGFEKLKKISLDKSTRNIVVFDLPIETFEKTLTRNFTGDLFCSTKFLNEFYDEIMEIASEYRIKLFIKPKYSIKNETLAPFYEKILNKLNFKNIDFEIIDPYESIYMEGENFDVAINLPYTSTYKTQTDISNKSIFYAPKTYHKYFELLDSIVFDSKSLIQYLKNKL